MDPIVIELNPRERRLYDRLRAALAPSRPGSPSGVRDLLLLLPDVVVLLSRLARDERVPLAAKALAIVGIGYVLSPIDLVPEVIFGPVGLVDDLVVVAAALSRMLNDVHPDVVRSHWPGQGDALDAIRRITNWAEASVSGRLRSALHWLAERARFTRQS
jgi:uncharacterized membrane protein YkvA (DUF1232 family)